MEDNYSSGRSNSFTMEQIAYKVIKDNIVESILGKQISRYLKEIDFKIHQFEGWLNSKDKLKDPKEFERRMGTVCQIYLNIIYNKKNLIF